MTYLPFSRTINSREVKWVDVAITWTAVITQMQIKATSDEMIGGAVHVKTWEQFGWGGFLSVRCWPLLLLLNAATFWHVPLFLDSRKTFYLTKSFIYVESLLQKGKIVDPKNAIKKWHHVSNIPMQVLPQLNSV